MKICVILEGCYPYVTGGVSTWMHQYIKAMPEHEFVIWAIGASSEDRGKFRYELPENVTEVHEVFLNDAMQEGFRKQRHSFTEEEMQALREMINCRRPDWETLFSIFQEQKISPGAFLASPDFLDILTKICTEEYPYTAFADLFHTVRSMIYPLLYLLQSEVPQADVYHAIATGYAGVLARLGGWKYHAPCMITEHGIYTREREEEIIRANWVQPTFKRFWVRFFYMLSAAAYDGAVMITSLFERAREMQIEMGASPQKCRYISNGIHYDRFCRIPPKADNGYVDIGAVLRIAPIKDVKTLLYAFSELKVRVPEARLWICGPEDDRDYSEECYELARQLGTKDIHFTGSINVLEWMEKFDFTILTSISEGQPLAVIESFAAGRPCVTTDVGSCKELLLGTSEDTLGRAGYCAPPMHREGLCEAMRKMCADPAERVQMGERAKKRVERYYRHEDMIKKYQETYDEVFRRWQELDFH
ncbi:MAG: GT4 family glycosyltransferase PelF [Lachnospiraceae bacterium]|nr:GT4 family glycosyltransferase PelF [Lachnospiraceae bacterium]